MTAKGSWKQGRDAPVDDTPPDVTRLVPRDSEADAPVRTRPWRPRACFHRRFELDRQSERVYCADCEEEIPAFRALLLFATEYERWVTAYDDAKARANRVTENLKDLLREERNAKVRARARKRREAP